MTAEPTPRRRLHHFWRAFLCIAAVIAVPVVTFVAIGLWPGLNFDWAFGNSGSRPGIGLTRLHHKGAESLLLRFGFGTFEWVRSAGTTLPQGDGWHYKPNARRIGPLSAGGFGVWMEPHGRHFLALKWEVPDF